MKNNNSGIKKPSLRDGSKNNVQRHHSKIHLSLDAPVFKPAKMR
jgi:hypothetical protein